MEQNLVKEKSIMSKILQKYYRKYYKNVFQFPSHLLYLKRYFAIKYYSIYFKKFSVNNFTLGILCYVENVKMYYALLSNVNIETD